MLSQLIEQHGYEAQNHFLRRLLLACAPTTTSPTGSSSNSNSTSTISPINGSANAPTPIQLPLYLRLLQQESKRLSSDPLAVEKFVSALLSGLNDPSTLTSDTFRALDLRGLIDKISLSPFEQGVLLLEIAQLSLPDVQYGSKANGPAVISKRRDLSSCAVDILRAEHFFEAFIQDLQNTSLSAVQASKLVATVCTDLPLDIKQGLDSTINEAEVDFDRHEKPVLVSIVSQPRMQLFNSAIEQKFGSVSASLILSEACLLLRQSTTLELNHAITYINRFVVSQDICTWELLSAIFDHVGVFAGKKQADQDTALLLWSLIKDIHSPPIVGQALVDALSLTADSNGCERIGWSTVIVNLSGTKFWAQSALSAGKAQFLQSLLSSTLTTGGHLVDAIFDVFPSPAAQVQLIGYLQEQQYDFAVPFLPQEQKVITSNDFAQTANTSSLSETARAAVAEQLLHVESLMWNHAKLVPFLLQLGDMPETDDQGYSVQYAVRGILERGIQIAPDLILLSILKIEVGSSTVALRVSS